MTTLTHDPVKPEQAAARIAELEAELESASNTATEGEDLDRTRAALHDWVDSVVGVVTSPGTGRVTLIHANGSQSGVTSPDLPYRLVKPVRFVAK
jgi:hypothetical protein